MQIEIVLWVVITVTLPAMVADGSLAFFTEAQTGVVLAAGTFGSVVSLWSQTLIIMLAGASWKPCLKKQP